MNRRDRAARAKPRPVRCVYLAKERTARRERILSVVDSECGPDAVDVIAEVSDGKVLEEIVADLRLDIHDMSCDIEVGREDLMNASFRLGKAMSLLRRADGSDEWRNSALDMAGTFEAPE